ncbi:hypothetical protein C0Q70_11533 [Pomacea canaliculata]|uniref:Uncharacterized protein n=1 Tax=Pomacea canaliculata TaxID=400727 RepID=A0A2T7P694_POMCA|nr:hypothetical protein C0Q70_11533 [Pomacea canaliculata]
MVFAGNPPGGRDTHVFRTEKKEQSFLNKIKHGTLVSSFRNLNSRAKTKKSSLRRSPTDWLQQPMFDGQAPGTGIHLGDVA